MAVYAGPKGAKVAQKMPGGRERLARVPPGTWLKGAETWRNLRNLCRNGNAIQLPDGPCDPKWVWERLLEGKTGAEIAEEAGIDLREVGPDEALELLLSPEFESQKGPNRPFDARWRYEGDTPRHYLEQLSDDGLLPILAEFDLPDFRAFAGPMEAIDAILIKAGYETEDYQSELKTERKDRVEAERALRRRKEDEARQRALELEEAEAREEAARLGVSFERDVSRSTDAVLDRDQQLRQSVQDTALLSSADIDAELKELMDEEVDSEAELTTPDTEVQPTDPDEDEEG